MGVFGSKGGLQDHGPVKQGVQTRWRWVAKRTSSGKTGIVQRDKPEEKQKATGNQQSQNQ